MLKKILFVVSAALVAACSGDSTGVQTAVNLSGAWSFSGNFSNAAFQTSCSGAGTANIAQTGTSITGTISQTGTCNNPAGTVDNSGVAQITGGQINGTSISFQVGSCSYTGTMSGNPVNRMQGNTTCTIAFQGQNLIFNGTWQAGR